MADASVLIIPDVHQDIRAVERILAQHLPRVGRVVFLGDYFDSWTTGPRQVSRTCAWLREVLRDDRFTFLLGNHDVHYLWPKATFLRCSGFSLESLAVVQAELCATDRALLGDPRGRIAALVHGRLLSHAGIHPHHVPIIGWSEAWLATEAQRAFMRLHAPHPTGSWLWAAGTDRGGSAKTGGPLWLDWGSFQDDVVLPPQVVGHTARPEIRQTGRSWCLDTVLRHVALLHPDGFLEVVPTGSLAVAV